MSDDKHHKNKKSDDKPTEKPENKKTEKWWPFVKIQKRTDIISLAAFIISLTTAMWGLKLFLQGAKIHFFSPEQILFIRADYGNDKQFLQVNAVMTYVNGGAQGYGDVIIKEWATVMIGTNSYDLRWQKYVHTSRKKDDRSKLDSDELGDAIPFVVDGGQSVTHETNFQPAYADGQNVDRRKNFLPYSDFIKQITNVNNIYIQLGYKTVKGNDGKAECVVKLDDELRNQLASQGWSAPTCFPADPSTQ